MHEDRFSCIVVLSEAYYILHVAHYYIEAYILCVIVVLSEWWYDVPKEKSRQFLANCFEAVLD